MLGFSAFISLGSMVDVGWGDLIDYLGNDPKTRSILVYMESVGDARSFLSAAREVALNKPIIVIKAGRTAAGGKAAFTPAGSKGAGAPLASSPGKAPSPSGPATGNGRFRGEKLPDLISAGKSAEWSV